MNILKKSIIAVLATTVLAPTSVFAVVGTSDDTGTVSGTVNNVTENDIVTLSFNHPQSISISAPNNVANRASGGIISREWQVVSNNAVQIKFAGKSPSNADAGVASSDDFDATPHFYKAEVDATGANLMNGTNTIYDRLVTTFGATIVGAGSETGSTTDWKWGNGATVDASTVLTNATGGVTDGQAATDYDSVLTGSPANLVGATDDGLNSAFGVVMPDRSGRFRLLLSAKGIGDVATTQSGDYQVTVVAQFIAAEQGNGTVTAADGTNLETTIDTYGILEADNADNTEWNAVTSTSVTGEEQSADVISTTTVLAADNATYY